MTSEVITSAISQAAGALMDLHPEMGGSYAYDLVESEMERNGVLDRLRFAVDGGSIPETLKHIRRVQELLAQVANNLMLRAINHDKSKLEDPEKSGFDRHTAKLRSLTYGSEEYQAQLKDPTLYPIIEHHWANNDHHPQFHESGISGMSLIQLLELACDWKAAGERHENGRFIQSIEVNRERFGMDDQLVNIFLNTAKEMGWE